MSCTTVTTINSILYHYELLLNGMKEQGYGKEALKNHVFMDKAQISDSVYFWLVGIYCQAVTSGVCASVIGQPTGGLAWPWCAYRSFVNHIKICCILSTIQTTVFEPILIINSFGDINLNAESWICWIFVDYMKFAYSGTPLKRAPLGPKI